MGNLDGRVAFITGAARGQGRNHAVRLAERGCDIIALDLCAPVDTVLYPLATEDDLARTAEMVESLDRRIVTIKADVRDLDAVRQGLLAASAQLGPVDIVIANAGIAPMSGPGGESDKVKTFHDTIDINLTGVWNTVQAAAPEMVERGAGGAIVLISSTSGLVGTSGDGSGGGDGYIASKHGVVGLMRGFTNWLAPHSIRVNSIHPTGVRTPMIENEFLAAHLEAHPNVATQMQNLLPVEVLDVDDISNAVLFLVSDDARYVTGVPLPVDAGFTAK